MKIQKKIVLLLSSLILLLVTTISLSIAWYSTDDQATVAAVEIALRAERNLYIYTSDEPSEAEIGQQEIKPEQLGNQVIFEPVSSMFTSKWYDKDNYQPGLNPKFYVNSDNQGTEARLASGGYFSKEFYLYSEDDLYASFDQDSLFSALKEKNLATAERAKKEIYTNQNITVEEIAAKYDNIVNCLRVSIYVDDPVYPGYYIFDPMKDGDTKLGGLLDTDLDGFYDSAFGYEQVYGEVINKDKIIYDDVLQSNIDVTGDLTCFNSGHQVGIRPFNEEASYANGFEIKSEDSYSPDDLKEGIRNLESGKVKLEDYDFKIPVRRGQYTRIVLSLYVEGWDRANIKETMGASFAADMKFLVLPGYQGEIL